MTDETKTDSNDADVKEIEALFVQNARTMSYADGNLTLHGVPPTVIIFSDRPERLTGHLPVEEFIDNWGKGDDSFAADPPNAVLSIFSEDEVNDIVVVLSNPVLTGNDLQYSIEITDGEMLASGGATALFIDMIGRPMTPVSVAGAHRRTRRRVRRRVRRR